MIEISKLSILTESAKYDVSCSSSGSSRKNQEGGLGNACFSGICHSFTTDGRCISLLKILLSNDCIYNCQYCINRVSSDIPRATATPEEICELTIEFYKRNYIEGLFLSSAIVKSPNYTMEMLFRVAERLRKVYHFNGYIHLKGVPGADMALIEKTGFFADRISFNMELPTEKSLKLLAPQKDKNAIFTPMKTLAKDRYFDTAFKRRKDFLPAGQTTQLIVGASPENDAQILNLSEYAYRNYKLKRVYFSAYIPTNFENSLLPYTPAPLLREHRLYQADWLMRFYGFTANEITGNDGNLSTEYDPKCAWALRNLHLFPVEINTAPYEILIRVPGIGIKNASRIFEARKFTNLDYEDLKRMKVVLKRAKHFITCKGKFYGSKREYDIKNHMITAEIQENARQLSFFDKTDAEISALTGEL